MRNTASIQALGELELAENPQTYPVFIGILRFLTEPDGSVYISSTLARLPNLHTHHRGPPEELTFKIAVRYQCSCQVQPFQIGFECFFVPTGGIGNISTDLEGQDSLPLISMAVRQLLGGSPPRPAELPGIRGGSRPFPGPAGREGACSHYGLALRGLVGFDRAVH